jgi:hypothetical protein
MKKTYKDVVGTSFYNVTLESSVKDLTNVLGEPYDNNTGDDKVNFEWEMETDNGDVFTVYDWKEYRVLNKSEIITFHIGGKNEEITKQAKNEIMKALMAK